MPENSFKIARPTINIAGQNKPELAEGLLSLLIVENIAGLYRCEATFSNWGAIDNNTSFLYFDRNLLDFGKTFKVKLGTDTIFEGRILGLEAHFPEGTAPELNVLAEDRLQDLRMTRRTRTFGVTSDVSDASIIRQIAGEHGLTPDIKVNGPNYKALAQVNQSDLAFLRERARSIDAEVWVSGSTLYAWSHAQRGAGTLEITYGNDLRSFSVLADLAHQRTGVTVSGWDVAAKQGLHYKATDNVVSGELNGGDSGQSILSSAFGKREEAYAHTVPLTNEEARAEAEAYFKLSARRFVVGRGIADVNSQLQVGSSVSLKGLGPLFNGKYYLTEVMHLFDGTHGIRTEFSGERPGLGKAQ
jgi:phage protein D